MNLWYRYRCPSCREEKSIKHSINSSPYIYCDYCVDDSNWPEYDSMIRMHRVITGGNGVILQGEGWEGSKVIR